MTEELTESMKCFITKVAYLESERERIFEETIAFVKSLKHMPNHEELLKLAKQKALEVANRLIEESLMPSEDKA